MVFVACILGAVAFGGAQARGATEDHREREGRALYAKGKYAEALDVFATLFADRADPIYLRNIGRCHQKMGHPTESIDAFREYLRRARVIPSERAEIEGFIREMEDLKARTTKGSAERSTGPEDKSPPKGTDAPPTAQAKVPPPAAPAPVMLVVAAPPPAVDMADGRSTTPLTHRWWFWAAIGAVVVGAAATAVILGSRGGADRPGCPGDFTCPPP